MFARSVLFAALSLALAGGFIHPVSAATVSDQPAWHAVAAQPGSTVEIDKSRISRLKNGKTAAWTRLSLDHPLLDFEGQFRYTQVLALNHYDCAHGNFATQRRSFWLDGREVKHEKVAGPAIWAQADSLDSRLLAEACRPRTVGEMQRTAELAAVAAQSANESPRAMRAELVSGGEMPAPRSMKVSDAAAGSSGNKGRMFDMPVIDKTKAVDPYAGTATPPANRAEPGHAAPVHTAAPAKAPLPTQTVAPPAATHSTPVATHELSRQERERMLATSGPRKTATNRKKVEKSEEPDFSHVHWGYAGLGAPENWHRIHSDYATCGNGKRQSPIDIRSDIKVDLEPIRFDYRMTEFGIVDNGHTVQVNVGEGSEIHVMGRSYRLLQFHFHRPSEERVNGKPYDMVAHLVHKDYDNNIAVIAVLIEKGSEHPLIQTLWNHMPLEVGMESIPPRVAIDLNRLLPEKRDYYTYMGSLTTPPCTENVLWMVLKNPIQVSPEQIGIFARLYPNNTRPVQPSNDRLIKGPR